jgi:superfamily II DNA/RNA helicase
MPPEIRKLADRFLSNPKTITVSPPSSTAVNVSQKFVMVPQANDWLKRETLRSLLKAEDVKSAFIFCNRKRDVASLHKSLVKHGFNAGALHGDMEQSERTATLDRFRKSEIALMVCSDVAARGLDIDAVSHVFNFDVPFNAEDYVHRIGRTGRAGLSGAAYTLITPDEDKLVSAIESLIKKTIERITVEGLGEPQPEEGHHRHRKNEDSRDRRHSKGRHDRPRRDRPHAEAASSETRREPESVAPTSAPVAAIPVSQPVSKPTKTAPPARQESARGDSDRFDNDLPAFLRRPPAKVKS